MSILQKISTLFSSSTSKKTDGEQEHLLDYTFKVVVIDFQDNIESTSGENTFRILQTIPNIDVSFYDEPFNKSFLSLESKTLFDMIDKGQDIIEKTGADVLVWGCRNNDKIRLNFQTDKQYEKNDNTFVSLLDSLYLPAELLSSPETFPEALKTLLHGALISSISPLDNSGKIHRKYLLKKIITQLSNDTSEKQLTIQYVPYIMNFLGIIYLSCNYNSENMSDFKITQNLFLTAIKHQDLIDSPLHLGCIYTHLGQLSDCAITNQNKHQNRFFKDAINNYRQAQRYLGKYTYPYDYGMICYKTSHLLFNYWKQNEDTSALRDAVSQLREVEKIFTPSQFPEFWASVQGKLGYLLSLLGNITRSVDIYQLAINSYLNQQKILTEKREPIIWASSQESIGHLHYKIGLELQNKDQLEDALECFHDALYIYENTTQQEKIKHLLISISKINDYLKGM